MWVVELFILTIDTLYIWRFEALVFDWHFVHFSLFLIEFCLTLKCWDIGKTTHKQCTFFLLRTSLWGRVSVRVSSVNASIVRDWFAPHFQQWSEVTISSKTKRGMMNERALEELSNPNSNVYISTKKNCSIPKLKKWRRALPRTGGGTMSHEEPPPSGR